MIYKAAAYGLGLFIVVFGLFFEGPQALQAADTAAGEKNIVTVRIFNVAFEPKSIKVKPGTTVRWVNLDPLDHDVTSGMSVTGRKARKMKEVKFPDNKFQSGLFGKGAAYEVTLNEKGEYPYFCNIHPIMKGSVVVE